MLYLLVCRSEWITLDGISYLCRICGHLTWCSA